MSWPSATVAVTVIAVVGAISIAAIAKYPTVDDALKFWSALSGLVGLATGAFVTYFFSKGNVQQAQAEKDRAVTEYRAAASDKTVAVQAAGILAGHLDKADFARLEQDEPAVARTFSPGA